jgi:signal transduction histidine kinase/ligand-binding sensor domain-containing protein/AraC-like DNA-binding protein
MSTPTKIPHPLCYTSFGLKGPHTAPHSHFFVFCHELQKQLSDLKAIWVFLVFVIGLSSSARAQTTYYSEANGYVAALTCLNDQDGLPFREVKSLYQDRIGYIWLATIRGVSRYDGSQFKSVALPPNQSLNTIEILGEDSEGLLWISTDTKWDVHGVVLIDTRSLKWISFEEKFGAGPNTPKFLNTHKAVQGADGTLYFTDREHNLIAYHHKTGFKKTPVNYSRHLNVFHYADGNNLWAYESDLGGVYGDTTVFLQVNLNGTIHHIQEHEGFSKAGGYFFEEDTFWYYIRREHAEGYFVKNTPGFKPQRLTHAQLNIQHSKLDFKGYLYFNPIQNTPAILALKYENPYVFVPNQGIVMDLWDHFPVMRADKVIGDRGIVKDQTGRFWLGGDFGLYILDIQKSPFTKLLYQPLKQFKNKGISCRGIGRMGDTLVVTTEEAGVWLFPGNSNSPVRFHWSKQMPEPWTYCFFESKDKRFQFIGSLTGVWVRDCRDGSSRFVENPPHFMGGPKSMLDLGNNRFLAGSGRGLGYYNAQTHKFEFFNQYNEFKDVEKATINQLLMDSNGAIWACTNEGLYTIDRANGITAYFGNKGDESHFLPSNDFKYLYIDPKDIFWLATDRGMIRWDRSNDSHRLFTTVDGLPNDNLYAVYPDAYGYLWISSDNGIIQCDPATNRFRGFQEKDGVSHREFNRLSHFVAEDGTMYFGGLNGVTAFHPRDFKEWKKADDAPLVVAAYNQFKGSSNKLEDQTAELLQSNQIVMRPDDRFFSIQVALLNYPFSGKKRYAYRIKGIEKNWNEQTDNTIRLSRLPYGNYTLEIKGQETDGHWSEKELHIAMKVVKPLYLQSWFLVLLALLLSAVVYSIYRFTLNRKLALQEAQKLREIDHMKSELFANISHEFRTPLTVIQGISGNIEGHEKEKTLIQRNVDNLLTLVGQVLDLSKLEAGKLQLHPEQSDVIQYIRYLIESFYSRAQDKDIRLVFDSDVERLSMDFDPLRFQQVIYNLVSNALKYTPSGGQIIVRTKAVHEAGKESLSILVKDSGIGIPEQKLPQIFERFYQVDGSHTRMGEGTGIGLAFSKQLIELMGGTIRVSSKEGVGSSFELSIPITRNAKVMQDSKLPEFPAYTSDAKAQDEFTPHADTDPTKPILLIIEDNRDVAAYIHSCVESGYQVHIAFDGEAGKQMAFELIPDIIISDVMMPRLDGIELTRLLKTDPRTSHIPLILLTAKAGIEDRLKGLEVGADAYLLKPFIKDELLMRMQNMIELRAQIQSRHKDFKPENHPLETMSVDELFLFKLHKYVEELLSNSYLDAQALGKHMHLGQAQLYRKVKALTGKTPALFIRSLRLAKAKELLQSGRHNVSEVAYEVGFSDPNYFSRCFSQEFGVSPNLFLKN